MDKNMFINKNVDDHRPKPLKCVKPKKVIVSMPILKLGRAKHACINPNGPKQRTP